MMKDTEMLTALGSRIKQIRLKKGFSLQQLSDRCGMEKANLSRIESGRINTSVLTLKKIADALSVRVIDFL